MVYEKLDGYHNTSDIMTKPVEADVLNRHMAQMGFEFRDGRHESTPVYTGLEGGSMLADQVDTGAEELVEVDRDQE